MISTTGITIFEHHCSHTGTVSISLFDEHTSCCAATNENHSSSCCTHQKNECPVKKESDCCNENIAIYKLESPLDAPNQQSRELKVVTAVFDHNIENTELIKDSGFCFVKIDNDITRDNSPPFFILYKQLKIAPSYFQFV